MNRNRSWQPTGCGWVRVICKTITAWIALRDARWSVRLPRQPWKKPRIPVTAIQLRKLIKSRIAYSINWSHKIQEILGQEITISCKIQMNSKKTKVISTSTISQVNAIKPWEPPRSKIFKRVVLITTLLKMAQKCYTAKNSWAQAIMVTAQCQRFNKIFQN